MTPLTCVSIVIATHNGSAFIDACLRTVLATRYPAFEVLVLDDCSTDGTSDLAARLHGHDAHLRIIPMPARLGQAAVRNTGIRRSSGGLIVFLDQDVEVEPGWLAPLVEVFDTQPDVGAAQPKLIALSDRRSFDYAGDVLSPFGFLVERAGGQPDVGQFDYQADILSGKGSALAVRREACRDIDGFDASFGFNLEETDFCWRAWLGGWRVVFTPVATVYHAYGSPAKKVQRAHRYRRDPVRFHACRNYIQTVTKNLGGRALLRVLPFHLVAWIAIALGFALRREWRDAAAIGRALGWCLLHAGHIWRARRSVQCRRRRADGDLRHVLYQPMPARFYAGKLFGYLRGAPFGLAPSPRGDRVTG